MEDNEVDAKASHDENSDSDDELPIKLRRNQYTMDVLQAWYDAKFSHKPIETRPQLTIIMPNFEEFKPAIVKDLIRILRFVAMNIHVHCEYGFLFDRFKFYCSNHCQRLPFVLILGVATSATALLNTLSFTETTRVNLRVFSGQPPNQILDQIFDSILLTPKCPFQLSRHVLEYLKDVFIFYDLTAKNFLRSIDYCLLDHYSSGNVYAVCVTKFERAKENIHQLKHHDFEQIRRLPSFRTYVEALLANNQAQLVIDVFGSDDKLRKQLFGLIRNVYIYFLKYYGQLRFLWTLVKDLPNAPMGRRLVDVYMHCQSASGGFAETDEFQKCWQLLGMTSKQEFIDLLDKCYNCLDDYERTYCDTPDIRKEKALDDTFAMLIDAKKKLSDDQPADKSAKPAVTAEATGINVNRTMFYQNLKEKNRLALAEQNSMMRIILDELRMHMEKEILPWCKAPPLHELFVYSDFDEIRSHLRGTSRSAIHKALTDPHAYLQVN